MGKYSSETVAQRVRKARQAGWKKLDLQACGVTARDLKRMAAEPGIESLRELGLDNNELSGAAALAQCLKPLTRLTSLDLSYNRVSDAAALAEGLKPLTQLESLDLRFNELSNPAALAEGLKPLTKLTLLNLSGNKLGLPDEVLETSDPRRILAAIVEMATGQARPVLEVKLVVLGDGRMGKTQLVNRLRGEPFDPDSTSTTDFEVHSLPFKKVGPKGQAITARVYDFGGQPHLWSAHRFFLATRHTLFVVAIDGTRQDERRLEYWLEYIRHYTRTPEEAGGSDLPNERRRRVDERPRERIKVPVLVVYTNCDRKTALPKMDREEERRPFETIHEVQAKALIARYRDVANVRIVRRYSSSTKGGLPEVRKHLNELIGGMDYIFRTQYSLAMHEVKEYLQWDGTGEARQVGGKTLEPFARSMKVDEFYNLFEQARKGKGKKPVEKDCWLWLQMLRNLGVVHWVGDVRGVDPGGTVANTVYGPERIRKLVYGIIRHRDAHKYGGVADRPTLKKMLCEACGQACQAKKTMAEVCLSELLELMKACYLVFPDRSTDLPSRWLVLDWISNRPVIETSKLLETSRIRFTGFFSENLILQLAGEWFEEIGHDRPQDLCRNQLRLVYQHDSNVNVTVVSDTDKRVMRVFASGGDDRNRAAFAQAVRDRILRLAKREQLPCVEEGWVEAAKVIEATKSGHSAFVKAEYHLCRPCFGCGDGVAFNEAWEEFCCEMLECHHGKRIAWRKPHDKGVDLLMPDEGLAYQCKSVASGLDGGFNAHEAAKSYLDACANQGERPWKEYFICTNVELTGSAWDKLPAEISKSDRVHTCRFWQDLCRKHPDKAARWFRVPVPVELLKQLRIELYG